jgi:hypothetical protein
VDAEWTTSADAVYRRWRPPAGVAVDALFGAGVSHGNGKLWVDGLA